MRAIALESSGSGPRLRELPIPEPRTDELLVSVRASSVNSIDRAIALGHLLATTEHEFPVVPGHDFAGVVERTGSDVGAFREGDEVYGFAHTPKLDARSGTWADYIVVPERSVAWKPSRLGFVQSAALPLARSAALMAVDAVDPHEWDRVLVVGATGGIGGYAVELAAGRGAHVIATAPPRDGDRLRSLGAAETIDYTAGDIGAAVHARFPAGLAGLIDVVSSARSFDLLAASLAPGWRAATTLGLAGGGGLRTTIENVYPLEDALEDALDALESFGAGTHGKTILLLVGDR